MFKIAFISTYAEKISKKFTNETRHPICHYTDLENIENIAFQRAPCPKSEWIFIKIGTSVHVNEGLGKNYQNLGLPTIMDFI